MEEGGEGVPAPESAAASTPAASADSTSPAAAAPRPSKRALKKAAREAEAASGSTGTPVSAPKRHPPPSKKRESAFDWANTPRRHVALKIMYIGTDFAGFAIQMNNQPNGQQQQGGAVGKQQQQQRNNHSSSTSHSNSNSSPDRTVEGELIRALELTRLVPSREEAHLTRCGRTDKGVHACGQVVAVHLRSRLKEGALGMLSKKAADEKEETTAGEEKQPEGTEDLPSSATADLSLPSPDPHLVPSTLVDSMCPRCGIPGVGYADDSSCDTHEPELDYCRMLNSVLPAAIRVVSWQPVPPHFNARFSCTARTYRYFFHADHLDLDRMQREASKLIGSHDFRNFCKVDPALNTHFTRYLTNIEVRRCEEVPEDCVQLDSVWPCDSARWFEDVNNAWGGAKRPVYKEKHESVSKHPKPSTVTPSELHPDTLCELLIHGNAFLYHQVRCIAAILFLVGRGVEAPDLVDTLLDLDHTPRKPNYDMAPEQPLVLYDTAFPSLPHTPGFDYQPRPATNPDQKLSFVSEADKRAREAEEGATAGAAEGNGAADTTASSSAPSSSSSSSSSSSPSSSPSPSTAAPLNLYPSAAQYLRHQEMTFAHFHHLWRVRNMECKVYELFLNQSARNMQAVRNECAKLLPSAFEHRPQAKELIGKRALPQLPQTSYHPPPRPRECAPLLDATIGCRGVGIRPMSYLNPSPYQSIFLRPLEKSYEQKVAALKGKKLERHQNVKDMSEKFRKDSSQYKPPAPVLAAATKMSPSPEPSPSTSSSSTESPSTATSTTQMEEDNE